MNILVINSGSSSVKFTCLEDEDYTVLSRGLVERIGLPGTRFTYLRPGASPLKRAVDVQDANQAISLILSYLTDENAGVMQSLAEIKAIGHRIVHGGETITAPVLIDDQVKAVIEACFALAPLHNPPNLEGIKACEKVFLDVPQVGVFDTAFCSSMPARAHLYGLPLELYKQDGVRRYGFHGTSHQYVSRQATRFFDRDTRDLKIVTCHLGNGCSVSAVRGGRCIDTSMGFTPMEGLMMGTRCGDIDPAIIFFLMDRKNMSAAEVNEMLNRKSGILGLAGIGSSDLRDITRKVAEGHRQAKAALEVFCYRIRKYIGAYIAALGGVDAIVFTAGIGENSKMVRDWTCAGLEDLGIVLDQDKNAALNGGEGEIHKPESHVKLLIVPTNEELEIARETRAVLDKTATPQRGLARKLCPSSNCPQGY
ncbi:MAG: acetate/propionate family kinase [Desulfobaccales bacterium]